VRARGPRAALALDVASLPEIERCRVLIALGRAAYFAGDLSGCVDAAVAATDAHVAPAVPGSSLRPRSSLRRHRISALTRLRNSCARTHCWFSAADTTHCGRGCSRRAVTSRFTTATRIESSRRARARHPIRGRDRAPPRSPMPCTRGRRLAPDRRGRAERLELATEMLTLAASGISSSPE
jgi:hypothetical protein